MAEIIAARLSNVRFGASRILAQKQQSVDPSGSFLRFFDAYCITKTGIKKAAPPSQRRRFSR
jgi:hypothetical protein